MDSKKPVHHRCADAPYQCILDLGATGIELKNLADTDNPITLRAHDGTTLRLKMPKGYQGSASRTPGMIVGLEAEGPFHAIAHY
jgi:hypothetical protein